MDVIKKYSAIVVLFFTLGIIVEGNAQNTIVKYDRMPVPEKFYNFPDLAKHKKQYESLRKEAFDLTRVLPKNYKKDGSVDYTKYIQQGLNEHANVVFPDFPIQINDRGLELRSNTILLFPPNSKLILKPSKKGAYEILRIHNVKNVKVFFPVINGNRNHHIGKEGEWGHGISIYSSSNIEIFNPWVENCWGDGICISQLRNNRASENIDIYYPVIENNRRNGITIASARNLNIIKPVISNTYGIPPMAAIDIEPSSQDYLLDNIVLESPVTYYSRYGIVLALTRLSGRRAKPVNITINNHHDINSAIGFRVVRFKEMYKQNPPLRGKISVNNPIWERSKLEDLKIEETFNLTPHIYFKGSGFKVEKKKSSRVFHEPN